MIRDLAPPPSQPYPTVRRAPWHADWTRASAVSTTTHEQGEAAPCLACHREHEGRLVRELPVTLLRPDPAQYPRTEFGGAARYDPPAFTPPSSPARNRLAPRPTVPE